MLSIEILKLEENEAQVKVKIPKRTLLSDRVCICQVEEIKKQIEQKLKENKEVLSCEFLTKVHRLKNKSHNGKTEQLISVKINKAEKKKSEKVKTRIKKTKAPTEKRTKSKSQI
jgi:hypothetical protein